MRVWSGRHQSNAAEPRREEEVGRWPCSGRAGVLLRFRSSNLYTLAITGHRRSWGMYPHPTHHQFHAFSDPRRALRGGEDGVFRYGRAAMFEVGRPGGQDPEAFGRPPLGL